MVLNIKMNFEMKQATLSISISKGPRLPQMSLQC